MNTIINLVWCIFPYVITQTAQLYISIYRYIQYIYIVLYPAESVKLGWKLVVKGTLCFLLVVRQTHRFCLWCGSHLCRYSATPAWTRCCRASAQRPLAPAPTAPRPPWSPRSAWHSEKAKMEWVSHWSADIVESLRETWAQQSCKRELSYKCTVMVSITVQNTIWLKHYYCNLLALSLVLSW